MPSWENLKKYLGNDDDDSAEAKAAEGWKTVGKAVFDDGPASKDDSIQPSLDPLDFIPIEAVAMGAAKTAMLGTPALARKGAKFGSPSISGTIKHTSAEDMMNLAHREVDQELAEIRRRIWGNPSASEVKPPPSQFTRIYSPNDTPTSLPTKALPDDVTVRPTKNLDISAKNSIRDKLRFKRAIEDEVYPNSMVINYKGEPVGAVGITADNQVRASEITESGKGIGSTAYPKIAEALGVLRSDTSHTSAGANLWSALERDNPGQVRQAFDPDELVHLPYRVFQPNTDIKALGEQRGFIDEIRTLKTKLSDLNYSPENKIDHVSVAETRSKINDLKDALKKSLDSSGNVIRTATGASSLPLLQKYMKNRTDKDEL